MRVSISMLTTTLSQKPTTKNPVVTPMQSTMIIISMKHGEKWSQMSSYISTKQINIIVTCLNIKRLTVLLLKSTFLSSKPTEIALSMTLTLTNTTQIVSVAVVAAAVVTQVVILIQSKVMRRQSSRRIWSDGGPTMAMLTIITNISSMIIQNLLSLCQILIDATMSTMMTEKVNIMGVMAVERGRPMMIIGLEKEQLNQKRKRAMVK